MTIPISRAGTERIDADAVVVGSGAGGAAAAWALARAGRSVVLVEEGSHIPPSNFSTDFWTAMRMLYRDNGTRAMLGTMIIPTMQARVVGGTTVVNSAMCFRLPDDILDEWVRDEGLRGLTPSVLASAYDEVERIANIKPETDEALGRNNLLLREACAKLGWQGHPTARNSRNCKGCGVCMTGCTEGAKLSTDLCFVPAMIDLGGKLIADCRVEEVLTENGRATGIRGTFIDPKTLLPTERRLEVRARAVVVSCGTMGTPVLLKKSGDLANSSKMVGRNLCNHTATGMTGFFDEEVRAWEGVTEGYCCSEFRRRGFMIEVFWAPPDVIGIRLPGFGIRHKDLMSRLGYIAGWGAMIRARSTGRVIAPKKGWTPTILYNMNRSDAALMQEAMKATADLLFAAGARFVCPGINRVPSELHHADDTRLIAQARLKPTDFNPIGNHPLGTCRMSEDPKRGVVNSRGETHDVRGLFIADGSIFPNAPGVNPQETIMALGVLIGGFASEGL